MQPCLTPLSDFKSFMHKYITVIWQNTWDETPLNNLHEIAPIVNELSTHLNNYNYFLILTGVELDILV